MGVIAGDEATKPPVKWRRNFARTSPTDDTSWFVPRGHSKAATGLCCFSTGAGPVSGDALLHQVFPELRDDARLRADRRRGIGIPFRNPSQPQPLRDHFAVGLALERRSSKESFDGEVRLQCQ